MDELPDEVLLKIFSYIPRAVQRTGRLVCRKWNRVCCDRRFTRNDQIYFNSVFQFHILAPYVKLSERVTFNLSFENQSLLQDTLLPSFWKICGKRVESLEFHDCTISFVSLITITRFCPHLKRLSIIFSSHVPDELREDFHILERNNFVVKSVTSFYLKFNGHNERNLYFTNYSLHKILSVFPNATDVCIMALQNTSSWRMRKNAEMIDRFSRTTWTVAGVVHHIQSLCPNVTKLSLIHFTKCIPSLGLISQEQQQILTKLQKLKELTISACHWNHGFPKLLLSLKNTAEITSLDLFLFSDDPYVQFSRHMPSILNAFSNLSIFKLRMKSTYIDAYFIQVLLASKLKIFHFVTDLYTVVKIESTENFQLNLTLEELVLRHSHKQSQDDSITYNFHKFAEYLPNLRSLEITNINDYTLQSIFKYQKRLRKLVLNRCGSCTEFGFSGKSEPDSMESMDCFDEPHSISDLEELESLTLYDLDLSMLSKPTFSSFLLPKLKFFSCDVVTLHEGYGFRRMIKNHVFYFIEAIKKFPLLEALYLNFKSSLALVVAEDFKKLLLELSRIKYVSIVDTYEIVNREDENLTDGEITGFFRMCPSLRMLHYNDKTFYYDILTDDIIIHKPQRESCCWVRHKKFGEKFS